MTILEKGSFSLNLGFLQVGADVSEADRQCAWELYTEITTRLSMVGKCNDPKCSDFSGEVLSESLDSVHAFFREARKIMRKYPVGQLERKKTKEGHLGVLINDLMNNVLRPFLEKWQSDFRHWWENESNSKLPPFKRQEQYPHYKDFLKDWSDVRSIMRGLRKELIKKYQLVDVEKLATERRKEEKKKRGQAINHEHPRLE